MSTINLPLMQRAAEISSQSFSEGDNTVEVVWTTGATVRRRNYTWDGVEEFDEELVVSAAAVRLGRLNTGAPFLDTHGTWSLADVIGAVVPGSARIAGGKGLARVQLSRAEADAASVQKIIDGIIRNVSVGYRIWGVERVEADGKIPLVRVIDWEPWEISAVPIGADAGAGIRSGQAGHAEQQLFPVAVSGGARGRSAPGLHAIRMRMRQRPILRRLVNL